MNEWMNGWMQITLDYNMRTYLPFVTNQLSMQTVLLIVVVMSVLRGAFKRSISAFRLGGVASLLAVIVQWPPIAGNLETMKFEKLWWWDEQETCNEFHSGKPYFDPKEHGPYGSEAYCEDSRWAVGCTSTWSPSWRCTSTWSPAPWCTARTSPASRWW